MGSVQFYQLKKVWRLFRPLGQFIRSAFSFSLRLRERGTGSTTTGNNITAGDSVRAISDTFEWMGQWFVPGDAQRLVPGRLTYTPKKAELRLTSSLIASPGMLAAPFASEQIVHGISDTTTQITLVKPVRSLASLSFGPGGVSNPESWVCPLVLVGGHVGEETTYPEMRARIPGFHIWQGRQLVEHQFDDTLSPYFDTYRTLKNTDTNVDLPTIDAQLSVFASHITSHDPFQIKVTFSGWVALKPRTPQNLGWYFDKLQMIVSALSFMAGSPMSPDGIMLATGDASRTIDVLFTNRDMRYCVLTKLFEFFLTQGTMGASLESVLQKWADNYPAVKLTSALAESVFASRDVLWHHVEFLSWMQALEGFHRAL